MNTSTLCKVAVVGLLLFITSAKAQTGTGPTQPVAITFAGRLAGRPFTCSSQYEGVGTKMDTVTPQDLRFFVSDVDLLDANGAAVPVGLDQDGVWQYKSVALVDLEDGTGGCRNGNAAMHTAATGVVPAGHYVGLRFFVGVPYELDHGDPLTAPSPLNMTAMFWNWQFGYKFIRAEVTALPLPQSAINAGNAEPPAPAGNASAPVEKSKRRSSGFAVHIGSTGCGNASATMAPDHECKRPNRVLVALSQFDPAKDVVIFDLDKLLADSDVAKNSPNTPPGCMSGENDPDCIPIMKALGLPFQDSPGGEQVVFYAEPKQ